MKLKLLKAGVGALALLATPFAAVAADMRAPVYKGPPRSVIAYYNWTGFYVGGTVGYGSGTSEWDFFGVETKPKGMIYGITGGYNWQAGSWVFGVEGDYNFSDMKGDVVCVAALTCETENRWFATFRGRIGYAFDRFMPYFTGGGAYGDIKASLNTVPPLSSSESRFGYTLGAGLEYAFLSNWTAKVEYLYVNLGSFDNGFSTPVVNNVSFDANVVRLGVNYKFGGGSVW